LQYKDQEDRDQGSGIRDQGSVGSLREPSVAPAI
jgi:hypothetical protein